MFETIVAVALVATALVLPFAAFAVAALRFGVDSRPGVDDRDQRPWLVPTR